MAEKGDAMDEASLAIGELARLTGTSVEALRYYERRGLVSPSFRAASGYRYYAPAAVSRVKAIRWAQGLGFRLDEIREMALAGDQHLRGWPGRSRPRLESKIREIDAELERLQVQRRALRRLAACRCAGICPVVERALSGPVPKRVHRRPSPAGRRSR